MHIPFEIGPGSSLRASTSFSSSVIFLSECSISFISFCKCSCKALWMSHTKEASEILSWPSLQKLQFSYTLMMKLLTKISLTLINTQIRTVHECEKWDNVLKKWIKERSFLISLQLPHYNLRTVHWLQMDRSLCTNWTLTFLIPQSTEMGFQKIQILCRYAERQLCPADNFLFIINQPGTEHRHSKDRTDIGDNRTNCLTVVYITLLLQASNNVKETFSSVNTQSYKLTSNEKCVSVWQTAVKVLAMQWKITLSIVIQICCVT